MNFLKDYFDSIKDKKHDKKRRNVYLFEQMYRDTREMDRSQNKIKTINKLYQQIRENVKELSINPYIPDQDTENTLKYFIHYTVNKLVKKQIYKPVIVELDGKFMTDYRYLDLHKMKDYQYKKYLIPSDMKNHKYIQLDKKHYYLYLLRCVETYIPNMNLSNLLFSFYTQRIQPLSTFDKTIYSLSKSTLETFCNIHLNFIMYDTGNFEFGIMFPKYNENRIFYEFEQYYLSIDNNIQEMQTVSNTLNKNKRYINLIYDSSNKDYYYTFFYYKKDSDSISQFAVLALFYYLIYKCDSNYLITNMTFEYNYADPSNKSKRIDERHANKAFIHKQPKLKKITFYQYEPHGYLNGFSYEKGIETITNDISKTVNMIMNDKIHSKFMYPIEFKTRHAVCPKGPQTISVKEDIGYCQDFSYFWHVCFLNILENINMHDMYQKHSHNILEINRYLTNIPIDSWIDLIDKEITGLYDNFVVEYPSRKYTILSVIDTMKYYIVNDYTDNLQYFTQYFYDHLHNYKDYLLDTKNKYRMFSLQFNYIFKAMPSKFFSEKYPTPEFYFQLIKHKMLNKFDEKYSKISIEEFFELYNEILLDMNIDISVIQDIASKKYKLRDAGYYNIFVEFAHTLFTLAHTSDYFTQKDKDLLYKSVTSENIVFNRIKDEFKNFTVVIRDNTDDDNDDNDDNDEYNDEYDEDEIYDEDDDNNDEFEYVYDKDNDNFNEYDEDNTYDNINDNTNDEDEENQKERRRKMKELKNKIKEQKKKEIEDDEKERQQYIRSLMDETSEYNRASDKKNTRLSKRYRDEDEIEYAMGGGDMRKGQLEFDEMMKEQEEESLVFYPPEIKCKEDKKCKRINKNFACDAYTNMCINEKETIGTKCENNHDCFSGNCKIYKYQTYDNGRKTNKEFKICRK